MGPYDSAISTGSTTSSPSSAAKPSEIDGLLAGAGYKVRSTELHQVAQRLERLETVMVNAPSEISQLASDVLHCNPSDIASWVDSMLFEFNPPVSIPSDLSDFSDLTYIDSVVSPAINQTVCNNSWLTVVTTMEEDSGIRLVHMMMTCAESVQRGDLPLAGSLIEEMQTLLTRVNTYCGIGKVARYFIDALSRRVFTPQALCATGWSNENEILYHHFYEACPYLKFAHFTANQAILEAFDGHNCVHVVDFNLMHGLQWPALIQALALCPGGPPLLRLTGIGPPSPDGRDSLREIGLRLAELARSVNVRFAFRGVAASRLEDVKPWMLQVSPKEVVAINSIMQLHRLLGSGPTRVSAIETVLGWIRSLNSKIVTVACSLQPEKVVAEIYIQREICNVLCYEGSARVERHEPLAKWRNRLGAAGFRPLNPNHLFIHCL
ncbi:hypothetical protein PVL29_026020 [Vitis rotundifolia]|uniref:DELLA protein n=1 Tax=Vitis rotundifolia TaxID=103349 RepID=A0AA39D6M9_VITRO|nr:hypothetical protein PVL29_026020 [Vitis rotundifolia]